MSARTAPDSLRRVSVIVPTKNERRNLPHFLQSLPPEVELIVCDASDDGTPDLARTLRPERTRVLDAPGSIAAARQLGAEASGGELLVFTDADVIFADDYFDRLLADTSWDALCGAKLSREEFADYYRLVSEAQRLTSDLLGIAAASGSNMALTRAAFFRVGGFRPDLLCNEDTELFLRAGRRGLDARFDAGLVVWARDHRRLRRGVTRKSVHSLVRNTLLYLACCRPALPRLLCRDWAYWTPPPKHAR